MNPSKGSVSVYPIRSRWAAFLPLARWASVWLLFLATVIGGSQLILVDRVDAIPFPFGVGGGAIDPDNLVSPTPTPTVEVTPTPSPSPTASPSPTPSPSPTLGSSPSPSVGPGPIAEAGEDQVVESGEVVILDGSGSLDPDGMGLAYTWQQVSGNSVQLDGHTTVAPSWLAADGDVLYVFSLTVEDIAGNVATDNVTVAVRASVSVPPDGTPDPRVDPDVVSEIPWWTRWLVYSLDLLNRMFDAILGVLPFGVGGSAIDPDNLVAPTPSPIAVISPSPSVQPTLSPSPTPSPTTSSTPSLSPTPVPSPSPDLFGAGRGPVAEAGRGQVVEPGDFVILDGGGSIDPSGLGLAYTWEQVSGNSVQLDGGETAAASFLAASEEDSYVFMLTVRDLAGNEDTDTVGVTAQKFVGVTATTDDTDIVPAKEIPVWIRWLVYPLNLLLLLLAFLATFVSLYDSLVATSLKALVSYVTSKLNRHNGHGRLVHEGKVVDYKTGKPIWGARIYVKTVGDNIYAKAQTNRQGQFRLHLSIGTYIFEVKAAGFGFSPVAATYPVQEGSVVYTGGSLHIENQTKGLQLVIPMKPTGDHIGALQAKILRWWQTIQQQGHAWSWAVFVMGSLLNTMLLIMTPQMSFLLVEIAYVVLVVIKVGLESKKRPSFGLVRDAVTHVPLDLAVVRLYEQGTNRLVMTRATDAQGKFFALPPPGVFQIVVSKPGYATFTKGGVEITEEDDAKVKIRAELMQVLPSAGLGFTPVPV